MLFETPCCNRSVITAAILLSLACLAVSIGCGANSEPSVDSNLQATPVSKSPESASNVGSQVAQSATARAKQISGKQTKDNSPANKSVVDKSSESAAGEKSLTDGGAQPSKDKKATAKKEAVAVEQASPKEDVSTEKKPKYTEQQLNKNHTTLVLADQPDLRARQLFRFAQDQMTDEQQDRALKLLLKEDYHFQRLIKKRQQILNNAIDGDQTQKKLDEIRYETVELSGRLRALVTKEILTPEQRAERRKQSLALIAEKEAEKLRLEKEAEQRRLDEEAESEPGKRELKR